MNDRVLRKKMRILTANYMAVAYHMARGCHGEKERISVFENLSKTLLEKLEKLEKKHKEKYHL